MTLSHRDRLLLTFADLASYGIAARDCFGADPDEGHVLLAAELAARHPLGIGSYVFWSERDDQGFDDTGLLTRGLTLHVSSDEVGLALRAAAGSQGLNLRAIDPRSCEVLTYSTDVCPDAAVTSPRRRPRRPDPRSTLST